jgi:hypothetical protein
VIIDGDHATEPVGLRQPRGQSKPEVVRGPGDGDYWQVIAVTILVMSAPD